MSKRPSVGHLVFFSLAFCAGMYFAFAAVRGDLGVMKRLAADAELENLSLVRDDLRAQIDALQNKTVRLSDEFLDLDLLDERARSVLGYMRTDELVIR